MKKTRIYLMMIMLSIGALTTVNASEKNGTVAKTDVRGTQMSYLIPSETGGIKSFDYFFSPS